MAARVLIVEDEIIDAIALAEAASPDVVLMDIRVHGPTAELSPF